MREISRRRFVLATGAVAATGALAGCSGNGNGGNGNGNGGGGPTGTAETYLSDNEANTYESMQDMTGESEVTVSVGAGDSGFAFEPAGITVDAGTTVVWEWTGEGGGHNVSSEGDSDFEFESERTDEEGFTFEQTFEESGAALYVCVPHRAQGMYGAVAVE